MSLGWAVPLIGEIYVSFASRKRTMTALANAAISGVVRVPSPSTRAAGVDVRTAAIRRAIRLGSLS